VGVQFDSGVGKGKEVRSLETRKKVTENGDEN